MVGGDELLLPPGAARQKAAEQAAEMPMPFCTVCREDLRVGEPVVSIVMDIQPGKIQMAPAHLACIIKVGQERMEEEEADDGPIRPEGN